ncbi:hypothetical protein FKM82_019164 [Ascaphus truei]
MFRISQLMEERSGSNAIAAELQAARACHTSVCLYRHLPPLSAGKRLPLSSVNGARKVDESDFRTPKPRATRQTRKKVVVTFSSDEESDLEAELSEAETPKNPTPLRRTSRSCAK